MNCKVCFIGHRNINCKDINERIKNAIQNEINLGCNSFTMGTHGEFDNIALNACRSFRKENFNIEIEVVITSLNKINKKTYKIKDEKGEVEEIYSTSPYDDVKTLMYDIEEIHFKQRITKSNKYMIDNSTILICYVDTKRTRSGAKTALNYAKRKHLKIINLYKETDDPTYGLTKQQIKKFFNKT